MPTPAPSVQPESLLTPSEAAKLLKISERTLYEIEEPRGSLPVIRFSQRCKRYAPADVLAYIERCKVVTPKAA